jgi:HK97 family phage portal protein
MSAITTLRGVLQNPPAPMKASVAPARQVGAPIINSQPFERYSQREAGRHLEAYGGASDGIDAVMNAVRLIMQTASQANYHFERGGTLLEKERGPDTPSYARIAPKDLVDLFDQPNPWFDYVELLELLIIDLLLVGNGYWLKFRPTEDGTKPLALYRLAPQLVSLVPGRSNLIEAYEYRVPGTAAPVKFSADEVIHFRLPNPHSPGSALGLGIIQGDTRAYDIHLGLDETMASFFQRGAILAGVVETDKTVPDSVFKRVQRQFAYLLAGGKNAYETAVLEKGLHYQTIQPTNLNEALGSVGAQSRDRIYAMFGPGVQGLLAPGSTGAVAGQVSDAQRLFDTKTMKPLLNRIQRKISRELTKPGWGVDYKIEYDYVMPEEDRIKLAGDFASLPGVKIKQVLQKVGLPPTGDSEIDEMVLNLPGQNAGPTGQAVDANGNPTGGPALADQPLGSESGRPPKPENTAAITPGAARQPGAQARVPRGAIKRAQQAAIKAAIARGDLDALDEIMEEARERGEAKSRA